MKDASRNRFTFEAIGAIVGAGGAGVAVGAVVYTAP